MRFTGLQAIQFQPVKVIIAPKYLDQLRKALSGLPENIADQIFTVVGCDDFGVNLFYGEIAEGRSFESNETLYVPWFAVGPIVPVELTQAKASAA